MTESQKFSRRDFLKGLGALIGSTALASCGVKPEETPHQLPTNEPTKIAPTLESTVPPTETAVPQQTATAEYRVGEGGAYTEVQQQVINSELTQLKKSQLENWMKYWYQFDNRPFDRESNQLVWKFVFDNPNTPTEAGVLIEAGGEYQGRMFYLPIKDGQYMTTPPEPSGNLTNIPEGFGPLEVSAGTEGLFLSYQNGNWVRVDSSGKVIETIDLQTGQWMKVEQELEMATTTLEGNFSKDFVPAFSTSFVEKGIETGVEISTDLAVTGEIELPYSSFKTYPVGEGVITDFMILASCNRYNKVMGNNITIKEYVDLVNQDQGKLIIDYYDEVEQKHKRGMYDPRNGVSVTVTTRDDMDRNQSDSFEAFASHYRFTINNEGKLIIVIEMDKDLVEYIDVKNIRQDKKNPQYIYASRLLSTITSAMMIFGAVTPEEYADGGEVEINGSEAQIYNDYIDRVYWPSFGENFNFNTATSMPHLSVTLKNR